MPMQFDERVIPAPCPSPTFCSVPRGPMRTRDPLGGRVTDEARA
jgi:hypothetical protein